MRRLLPVLSITAAAVLLAIALAPACADQCAKKDDCATGEVCSSGSCQALLQEGTRCAGNSECGSSGLFVCRAGRCELKEGAVVVPVDSGVVLDLGVADLGVADMGVRADGGPDAGVPDGGIPADGGPDGGEPGDAGTTLGSILARIDNQDVEWNETNSQRQTAYSTGTGYTAIVGTGNVGSAIDGQVIRLRFNGNMTGVIPCAMMNTFVEWQDATQSIFHADQGIGTCSFTIDSYGAVGSPIIGTFTGTLVLTQPGNPAPANNMVTIAGGFSLVREPDVQ